jgi:hypothetical protein
MTPLTPEPVMSELEAAAGAPLSRIGRGALALAGLALLAGFALAAVLEPDPRGYGTHQRLGLPECTMRTVFGIPCPGCGMTTSFAHFVRGNWSASYAANPAGLWMALGCVTLWAWCWAAAARGKMWLVTDPWATLAWLLASWGAVSVLIWVQRL